MIEQFLRELAEKLQEATTAECKIGLVEPSDGIYLYSLPDSLDVKEYFDGSKLARFRVEILSKSKNHKQAIKWAEVCKRQTERFEAIQALVKDSEADYPFLAGKTNEEQYIYTVRAYFEIER